MKPTKTAELKRKADPVLSDQGGRSTPADPLRVFAVREETVRRRAYEIYEQRGRLNGRALEDWLTAESEITGAALRP